MPTYITTDESGRITASADWPFQGSVLCPCDVVRYPNGGLYRADTLPPVYGNPGTSEQQIDGECPDGWVIMKGLRPEPETGTEGTYLAQKDGVWLFQGKTLEEAKAEKLAEINAAYSVATSALVESYPETELLTFDKQEAEARKWLADNSVSTPLVNAIAAGRQIDKAELVKRIIAKADSFTLAAGYLTGQRQHYEDMLGAASTLEDIESIKPVYTLPETV